jgi:hypothetical protein
MTLFNAIGSEPEFSAFSRNTNRCASFVSVDPALHGLFWLKKPKWLKTIITVEC